MSGRLGRVTGASGNVGGRLVPELERHGERVRCLARRPDDVRPRVGDGTEVAAEVVAAFHVRAGAIAART